MNERTILHVDLNNFYASVECSINPSIKDYPVAVGGNESERHGIILASNYHAKAFGIKTGSSIREAISICPDIIIVPPSFHIYSEISKRVREIFYKYSDKVEPFGIDEAWIDVTNSLLLYKSALNIAQLISQEIKDTFNLTVSIGISFNKIFSKLGSDYKKPDAITIITRENYKEIVWPLPVEDLMFVGKANKAKLNKLGIYTIGELANKNYDFLKINLGKMGEIIYYFANGFDNSEVAHKDDYTLPKSVGNSITTKVDINNLLEAKIVIFILSESIATRLKELDLMGSTISISYRDANLETLSRQVKLENPCDTTDLIAENAIMLLDDNYDFNIPLRSLGVAVSSLVSKFNNEQINFFYDNQKEYDKDIAIRNIKEKYGNDKIKRANSLVNKDIASFDPKGDHIIFPVGFKRDKNK